MPSLAFLLLLRFLSLRALLAFLVFCFSLFGPFLALFASLVLPVCVVLAFGSRFLCLFFVLARSWRAVFASLV